MMERCLEDWESLHLVSDSLQGRGSRLLALREIIVKAEMPGPAVPPPAWHSGVKCALPLPLLPLLSQPFYAGGGGGV